MNKDNEPVSLTIKVEYKKQVYNLGKGIKTFSLFENAVWSRFPEFFGNFTYWLSCIGNGKLKICKL